MQNKSRITFIDLPGRIKHRLKKSKRIHHTTDQHKIHNAIQNIILERVSKSQHTWQIERYTQQFEREVLTTDSSLSGLPNPFKYPNLNKRTVNI